MAEGDCPGAPARAARANALLTGSRSTGSSAVCKDDPLVIRVIITSLYEPGPQRRVGPEYWRAELETGELLLARTRLPLQDGARALLARGADPERRITMRHGPAGPDCFTPVKLGIAAQLTVSEPAQRSAHFRRWRPGPDAAGACGGGAEIPASSA